MLDSICVNRDAIKTLSLKPENKSLKNAILNEQEFFVVEELCNILEPLKNLTESISGSFYCTNSILYPSFYNLIHYHIPGLNFTTTLIKNLRDELLDSLNGRFKFLFSDSVYLCLTFLDCCFKNFDFLKEQSVRLEKINEAKEFILKFFEKNLSSSHENTVNDTSNVTKETEITQNSNLSQISLEITESNRQRGDFNRFLDDIFDKKKSNAICL